MGQGEIPELINFGPHSQPKPATPPAFSKVWAQSMSYHSLVEIVDLPSSSSSDDSSINKTNSNV